MGPHILVVDDNAELSDTVCAFLREEGFEATSAADGREALRTAAAADPDVIVLDVRLPDIDGVEVMSRLQRRGVDSPVILESCLPPPRHAAADAFLPKPFDLDRLLALVRKLLAARRLESCRAS